MLRLVNTAMSALLCVACAPQDRQAAPVSSEVGSASALPSSVAQSQEAVDAGGGPSSGAPEEQAQAEGPALASRKATTMCIENLSSVTPVVTFVRYIEQAGEGALAFRARACATGFSSSDRDVRGRIGLPAHIAPMEFWADNYSVSYPGGGLSQEGAAICLATGGYSVGERRMWDDGLLRYILERQPDGVGKVFRITIGDSARPSADGKPATCTRDVEGSTVL